MPVFAETEKISQENFFSSYDQQSLFKLSYGLYLLSAQYQNRDNGAILNSVSQVTTSPDRLAVSIHNGSLTRDMIESTGQCNLSVLTQSTPFSLFETFGYQSGRAVNKFASIEYFRTENGILVPNRNVAAVFMLDVERTMDLSSHTLFLCTIRGAKIVSDAPVMTYEFYKNHIKPDKSDEGNTVP